MGGPVAIGAQVIGSLISAKGQMDAGDAQRAKAQYEAAQMRINAGQEQAAGEAQVQEQVLQTKLLQSRALAVAAASGAGALDPTVVKIISGIAKVGEYNKGMTMYNANSRARNMLDQSTATEFGGEQAQKASRYAAAGTLLSTATKAGNWFGDTGSSGGGGLAGMDQNTPIMVR